MNATGWLLSLDPGPRNLGSSIWKNKCLYRTKLYDVTGGINVPQFKKSKPNGLYKHALVKSLRDNVILDCMSYLPQDESFSIVLVEHSDVSRDVKMIETMLISIVAMLQPDSTVILTPHPVAVRRKFKFPSKCTREIKKDITLDFYRTTYPETGGNFTVDEADSIMNAEYYYKINRDFSKYILQ